MPGDEALTRNEVGMMRDMKVVCPMEYCSPEAIDMFILQANNSVLTHSTIYFSLFPPVFYIKLKPAPLPLPQAAIKFDFPISFYLNLQDMHPPSFFRVNIYKF